jgi:hypothetical protein
MLAAEPTWTDAKSFSFRLAITQTVDKFTTVKSSWALLTTNPRLAVRVSTTPSMGAGTVTLESICSASFNAAI